MSWFVFEDWTLDHASGDLTAADGRVERLRPQTLRVWLRLLERGSDVTSREDLYEAIWGEEVPISPEHGLNLCIREIRSALGETAGAPRFVETLPKRGYRWLVPVRRVEARPESPRPSSSKWPVWRLRAVGVGALLFVAGLFATIVGSPGVLQEEGAGANPVGELELRREYLDARYLTTGAQADPERAIELYLRVLAHDPDFVPAWSGLGSAYLMRAQRTMRDPLPRYQEAVAASAEALARDEEAVEALLVLGVARLYTDLDWSGAGKQFELAARLAPEDPRGLSWWSRTLAVRGEHETARQVWSRARDLAPTSNALMADEGWLAYFASDFDEAASICSRAADLDPESYTAVWCLQSSLLAAGQDHAAATEVLRLLALVGQGEPADRVGKPLLDSRQSEAYWRWSMERLDQACTSGTLVIESARIAAHLGRREEAVRYLRQAVERRLNWTPFLVADPMLADLLAQAQS